MFKIFRKDKKPSYFSIKTRRNVKKLEELCIKNKYEIVYSDDNKSSLEALSYDIYDVDSKCRFRSVDVNFEYFEYDKKNRPIYRLVYNNKSAVHESWYYYEKGKVYHTHRNY